MGDVKISDILPSHKYLRVATPAHHREVPDDQATPHLHIRISARSRPLGARPGYNIEAARWLGLAESALPRWIAQPLQERGGVTPISEALTPEQQKPRNWKRGSFGRRRRNRS
jgi:hypothetical protein